MSEPTGWVLTQKAKLPRTPTSEAPVCFSRGSLHREGRGTACRPRQLSPPDFVSGAIVQRPRMDMHYVEMAGKAHRSTQVDAVLYFEQTVGISTDGDVVDADLIPMV